MINAKLQNIIDTKSAIGNAIVNKGGTITGETPFFNYAAQIDGISTGTPQTIFAASNGSKWALTNVVNLVNSAGNVTHDFNRWQPANNSTSDPILNIGTVGANISGNIRIVQVNQVNIAQYVNIVATAPNGAKYVGYNGYDLTTNPTPTGNTTFNRWLLNNSASGTVIFANATFVNGGIYNGPNAVINETNLARIGNTVNYNGEIEALLVYNGFIYAGGAQQVISKYHEGNLAFVGNTPSYGGGLRGIVGNNGFIYAGGVTSTTIKKYHEGNLAFVSASANYGGAIRAIALNNGFIYAGGATTNRLRKYHESNFSYVGETSAGGTITSIDTSDGFVFYTDFTNVRKVWESNLSSNATITNGNSLQTITTNNGFVYTGDGSTNRVVRKYHATNLGFIQNTADYGGCITSIVTNNAYLYVGGRVNRTVQKYHESNFVFVANTVGYGGDITYITTNNGFIYAAGDTNQTVQKFQESASTPDNQTFFNITTIKE
jgi:hypothetical protein